MTNHVSSPEPTRPMPPLGVRIARIAYAAIPIATAAVLVLGSFI